MEPVVLAETVRSPAGAQLTGNAAVPDPSSDTITVRGVLTVQFDATSVRATVC